MLIKEIEEEWDVDATEIWEDWTELTKGGASLGDIVTFVKDSFLNLETEAEATLEHS